MQDKSIYLDYASTTPIDPLVLDSMKAYFSDKFYNPSAIYLKAKSVNQDINVARSKIASLLGVKTAEIIFTAGATEANNLAISGIMQMYPGANMIISSIEHESVLEPADLYLNQKVPVNRDGIVDLNKLNRLINEQTVLVSIMYANNEIGTIQPIKEIASIIKQLRQDRLKSGNKMPLYLHTDATQATNYLSMLINRLEVDLLSLNASKIYGPKQSGLLFVKTGTILKPLILGGGQERNLRSGTENVASIIGLSKALELASTRKKTEAKRLSALQQFFIAEINSRIKGVSVNGSLKHRLPNNINITIDGADNERLVMELDERGIMCATGSACSANSRKLSHTLQAIGLTDDQIHSSLRFSMGLNTTKQDIIRTITILESLLPKS